MNPLIQLKKTTPPLLIALVLGCLGFRQQRRHCYHRHHRTEAIPATTPLRELALFSTSQPAPKHGHRF